MRKLKPKTINPMKKLLSLLLIMAAVVNITYAQMPFVVVSGYVTNAQTGYAIQGQLMYISVDSLNYPGYTSQVFTNDNGYYTDTIPLSPNSPQGIVMVSTSDCNGTMATATGILFPGVQQIVLNFSICGNATSGCMASFRYEPSSNDMLTFAFFDESYTSPGATIDNWFWDFGDNSTSNEQHPVHTYSGPGLYNACLYINSGDSSCFSSFCQPIDAGSTNPGSCQNYFWYYADSTGTPATYTFEGWTENGQADSWTWDFGDGTTGTGQTVSHFYTDPNQSYLVCLTTTGTGPDGQPCTAVSCQEIFNYTPSPCESSFWFYPDSTGTNFVFEGWAMNNQIDSWIWDFGDGATATGQTVTHSFTDPNANHTVCLTTTGSDPVGGTCSFTSCQEVFIYVPSPCESYFWYHPDSTGTAGLTFEGWAMNGTSNNQIDSWIWDFGDGTTASGQIVNHIFNDPAVVYTVCLTTTASGSDSTSCSYVSCQEVSIYYPSPCENYFEATTNDGNTYSFEGFVINGMASQYFWDFGDGGYATGQQVTHTFQNGNGTVYNVCLTTLSIDPANDTCSSTSCQMIFPGGGGGGCQASMSALPDPTSYTFFFTDQSQGDYNIRVWDFGDGQQSMETNPVHTYQMPGIYWACLTIKNTMNNCWDQTCQEIWVNSVQPDCQASFIAFPSDSTNSSLSFQFINTSAPGFTSQQWSFGDGTGSTDINPVHVYANPGIYTACLTIWDTASNCQSSSCMQIFAGENAGDFTIAGLVMAGNTVANQGIVWLIGATNNYYAETTINPSGTYNFGGVPAGSYYIYAMLTPGSPNFFEYLPTYYASSLTWQGATIVTTGEPNGWYPINLLQSLCWVQGSAGITGTINYAGTFKSGGTPAANVEIVLFNSTGLPVAYTFSDNEGNFEFTNLPYGEYTLYAEMTGKTTETVVIFLAENASTANIELIVTATAISALGTGDDINSALTAGNPYPNPVKETLFIELNALSSGTAVMDVIDLQGRVVLSESTEMSSGNNRFSLSTKSLTQGMYLLRISADGREPLQRKFVK